MTGSNEARDRLLRFLETDEEDVGCEKTMQLLHVYVELVLTGDDPERDYPGITAHLRNCEPCVTDFEGLLNAVRGTSEPT